MSNWKVGQKFQIKSKVYKFNGKYRKLIVTRVLETGIDFTDVEDFGKPYASKDFIGYGSLKIYKQLKEFVELEDK
jgi:hypothetical protein